MNKKKGFTLIELLAVILILGIIALIAIPTVTSVIDESKKGSLKTSAKNIAKVAEEQCRIEQMRGKDITNTYVISNGKLSQELGINHLPDNGKISVSDECSVDLAITDGEYCAIKEGDSISINSNTVNCGTNSNISETESSCFIFDENTRTITGYNYDLETCPSEISIPATINSIPVEHIADMAFVNASYDMILIDAYKAYELDGDEEYESFITAYDLYNNIKKMNYTDLYDVRLVKLNDSSDLLKRCFTSTSSFDEKEYNYEITDTDNYLSCIIYDTDDEITSFTNMYSTGLTAVDFSEAVNLKSIGDMAFYGNEIETVKFSILPKLTDIGFAVFQDNYISGVVDISGLKNIGKIPNSLFHYNDITSVKLPNNITEIGHHAFCENYIESVELPNTLLKIGINSFFNNLIEKVKVPETTTILLSGAFESNQIKDLELSQNTTILYSDVFYDNQLTKVTIPDKVRIIDGYAFGKNSITEVDIPSSVEYFSGFNQNLITEIEIPSNVETIGSYALFQNDLTSFTLPNTVKSIEIGAFAYNDIDTLDLGTTINDIGTHVFYGNTVTLDTVTIPDSLETIPDYMFYNSKINNLIVGKNVKTIKSYAFSKSYISNITWGERLNKIERNAFDYNDFTELVIPSTVTSMGSACFMYNDKLTKVTLPDSVLKVEYSAFANSPKLKTVNIGSGITKLGSNAFGCYNESACSGVVININRAENAISGSPWGNQWATVNWTGTN